MNITWAGIAVCIAALLALVVLASAIAFGETETSDPVGVLESILSNPRDGYPETVALVNGKPISGEALALGVNTRSYQSSTATEADLAEITLGDLITDELMLQDARGRGLWPTEDRIDDEVTRYKEMYAQLPDGTESKRSFDEALHLQGLDILTIGEDLRFREVAARWVAMRDLKEFVRASLSPDEQKNVDSVNYALFDHTKELWTSAEIELLVDVVPVLPEPQATGFIPPLAEDIATSSQ